MHVAPELDVVEHRHVGEQLHVLKGARYAKGGYLVRLQDG